MKSRVLIIAGSDSGGGAGIQGDIKTVTALGGYAATAITALTAQNTTGVYGIHEVPPDFIKQQIRLVLEDIGTDAIKTGMLVNAAVINAVADAIAPYPDIPLILDPVMIAKGGAALLAPDAVEALKRRLIPRALLLTPNVPEAEVLLGEPAESIRQYDDMRKCVEKLLSLGPQAVLLKGGHLKGEIIEDILVHRPAWAPGQRMIVCSSPRIDTPHTHGTGCALASAIATFIAQGEELEEAVRRARAYVHEAIRTAPGLGKGHGPLNHGVKLS